MILFIISQYLDCAGSILTIETEKNKIGLLTIIPNFPF